MIVYLKLGIVAILLVLVQAHPVFADSCPSACPCTGGQQAGRVARESKSDRQLLYQMSQSDGTNLSENPWSPEAEKKSEERIAKGQKSTSQNQQAGQAAPNCR